MPLEPGRRLGPYEILGPIGAGGMGEIYEAHDTRLGRTVAIKVLPEALARDEERRARFEREARTVSQLAHPHVCTLHDVGEEDGVSFLVMEHCDGETLASRLERGALPLSEMLRHGAQIALALDAAHRRGIVHRDLKPANVMLTRAGVKLLDFGLARLAVAGRPGADDLPTTTFGAGGPLTDEGTVLGTYPYMAPEQVEGRQADSRSDIFALGAVLYEMGTGRRAFEGRSAASVMAAVLRAEPEPLANLQPVAPPALEHVVSRCLAKDPDERWQSARDVAVQLRWLGSPAGTASPVATAGQRRDRLAWIVAGVAVAAALAAAVFLPRTQAARPEPALFAIAPAERISLTRLSPDGRQLSFTAGAPDGTSQIWLRPLASLEATALPGTEGAGPHFWSPDSRFVAFYAEGTLMRVDVGSGAVRALCDAPGAGPFRLGAWSRDGTILFVVSEAPGQPEGLFRVSADGGSPEPFEVVDAAGREMRVAWPSFLPDGRHFLSVCSTAGAGEDATDETGGTCVVSMATGEARRILDVPSYSEYAAGHLLYSERSVLFAQPFDHETLRLHGEPVRLAGGLTSWAGMGPPEFSASTGVLVHQNLSGRSRLVWRDRSGRSLAEVGSPGLYEGVRIDPDGRRAVVTLRDPRAGLADLWLIELERGLTTRFTSEGPDAMAGLWSPDGSRIVYCKPDAAPPFLHLKSLGGGVEEVLLASSGTLQCPGAWSPDGRSLLFMDRHPRTGWDLWLLDLGKGGEPRPVLRTPFQEILPSLSPDGGWMAYVSDESGRMEIYLQRFSDPGERIRVSADGGTLPRWRGDGRELFYLSADARLVAVPVDLTGTPEVGTPQRLFGLGSAVGVDVLDRYDVIADGQRFLTIDSVQGSGSEVIVILDWEARLSER